MAGRWLVRQGRFFLFRYREAAGLAARGLNSLKVRGLGPTLQLTRKRLFPPRRQPYRLQLYSDYGAGAEVRLDDPPSPRASVIVPVHDQLHLTLRCLHALSRSGDRTPFEVVLVDDASSDATAARLSTVPGLRYQRNEANLGFIGSCNAGAARARGEFLVFLNNDTLVQPGWLDALLDTFDRHPFTGLAGSKLVYPDGRLQEAGGIVHADGRPSNYGRFEDPLDPRFNFVRLADYCSGAALAIPRELFKELGGFDPLYTPAYFEDTDLAMRVRARGLAVRYQPASVVVHLEGVSSGTNPRLGVKAHQTTNAVKFQERWRDVLDQGFPAHDALDLKGDAADHAARHRYRRHVLVIDSYTPTPDRDSGSVRMVELLGLLVDAGCGVVFFSQNLAHDGHYTEVLQQRGVEVWWHPWIRSLTRWLDRHGERFDAVIVSRHYVLSPLLPMLRELAPRARIVFDTVDLHFLREEREAAQSGDPAAKRTAEKTREAELALVRGCDSTWVVSNVEREMLQALEPAADVRVVSNIHGTGEASPGFAARRDLVFVGSYRHPPNVDAARWMVREILPRVREQIPDVALHLVGADAPPAVLALANRDGVRFLGHVPDLESLLDAMRVTVAPLRFGAGIKGKINQSLARGLPVVATPCAVEGMFLKDEEDVLCAESAEDFANAIVRLYRDEALWNRLREAGIENTRRHFSRDNARAVLLPWLDSLRTDANDPSAAPAGAVAEPHPSAGEA
jgi:GT2 family glycosyltransferase/glycosyltransferase involved in cell wall biosynthesis